MVTQVIMAIVADIIMDPMRVPVVVLTPVLTLPFNMWTLFYVHIVVLDQLLKEKHGSTINSKWCNI